MRNILTYCIIKAKEGHPKILERTLGAKKRPKKSKISKRLMDSVLAQKPFSQIESKGLNCQRILTHPKWW